MKNNIKREGNKHYFLYRDNTDKEKTLVSFTPLTEGQLSDGRYELVPSCSIVGLETTDDGAIKIPLIGTDEAIYPELRDFSNLLTDTWYYLYRNKKEDKWIMSPIPPMNISIDTTIWKYKGCAKLTETEFSGYIDMS